MVLTVPANGAAGVGTTTPFVTTFSTAMDPDATSATFLSGSFQLISTITSWSADSTRLTNTPASGWPANQTITWAVSGQDTQGNDLGGFPIGTFSTGTGGGGGGSGSGTNAMTDFIVERVNNYDQTNAATPVLDTDIGLGYGFAAFTTLASNRTATSITVATPVPATNSLNQNIFAPEDFTFFDNSTDFASFDAQYPGGNYVFNVQSSSSNQQVTVDLPAGSTQPPAPHISNFTAAQSIDPSKSFTLTWDPFTNGTAADYVSVEIDTNFTSGALGATNALNGTATSVTIAANTLPPNRFLDSCYLTFHHFNAATNSSYATVGLRASSTRFFVTTTGGSVGTTPLVFTNLVHAGGSTFSFKINCSAIQTITVEYSTNLQLNSWTTLLVTNSPGTQIQVTDALTGSRRFYRARYGN